MLLTITAQTVGAAENVNDHDKVVYSPNFHKCHL